MHKTDNDPMMFMCVRVCLLRRSGMTVKFFPLFFGYDLNMKPEYVQVTFFIPELDPLSSQLHVV